MTSFAKLTITAITSAVVGGALTLFVVITEPLDTARTVVAGGIPVSDAYEHSHPHTRGLQGWRGNTTGIWYRSTSLRIYLDSLDSYASNKAYEPPAGYYWRIGVYYGKGKRKNNNKSGLMTMFMPVLVNEFDSTVAIDAFLAKKYYENSSKLEIPNPGNSITGMTYADVYKKYYYPFETKRHFNKDGDCTDCIVFDSGNMFP